MPSKKRKSNRSFVDKHIGFFPLLTLIFIMWVLYRSLFQFPVWFDETIGKAVFFGLPVWLYVVMTGSRSVGETFAPYKLKNGLLLGLAFGGIFGFVSAILALYQRGGVVQAAWVFSSPVFWREFFLAMMTAFWETLLFYSFVMTIVQEKFARWTTTEQVFVVGLIFLLFHAPNTLLRFDLSLVLPQLLLMLLFGIGQAYLFAARRNSYALILSHAIWGMVLLVHFW